MTRSTPALATWLIVASVALVARAADPAQLDPTLLKKGDLIAVTVAGLAGPDSHPQFRAHVGAKGELPVPRIGAPKIEGKTLDQAARQIAVEFQRLNILPNPVVTLRLVEPADRSKLKLRPIAEGDLLSLVIYDMMSPGVPTRFDARVTDGAIGVPLLGALRVVDLTEADAIEAIRKRLRGAHLIAESVVSLHRAQSADQADVKLGPIARGDVLRIGIASLDAPGRRDRPDRPRR
ncbi:MAG TPA: polysaccharide biosynthesis/export family protein [Tepidisphaeraceae bacterium]